MKAVPNYIELQKQVIDAAKKLSEINPEGNSYVEIKQATKKFANVYHQYVMEVKRLKKQ